MVDAVRKVERGAKNKGLFAFNFNTNPLHDCTASFLTKSRIFDLKKRNSALAN